MLTPTINKPQFSYSFKTCAKCGTALGPTGFVKVRSWLYPDGTSNICSHCIDSFLEENDWDWKEVDKLCQSFNIPFIPSQFEQVKALNQYDVFQKYADIFGSSEYEGINWSDYFKHFKELRLQGRIEDELPKLSEEKRKELKDKWGHNYDDDALDYLESLYNGLLSTQNVNGILQGDQGLKLCKISYEIDQRIASGEDFDKLLTSYDKIVKMAEFTPKNVKNLNDFDTCGELVRWLEKKGWRNKFYDDVSRDIVDETIKNIQAFNQRLYINESGIGEEITNRIENLKSVQQMENSYDLSAEFDIDKFENTAYEDLMEKEEFKADIDES